MATRAVIQARGRASSIEARVTRLATTNEWPMVRL